MIGGYDISFSTETPEQAAEGAIRLAMALWKKAVIENAETGELLGPAFPAFGELPQEVFIYRDASARASWGALGAAPENRNSMIHLICGDESMTVVVDGPDAPEMAAFLDMVRDHLCQDIFCLQTPFAA